MNTYMAFEYNEDSFGTLGRELRGKLENDNDAKVIIVGKNAGTGLGKTTLAIHLCRFIDPHWNPHETGAYWDVDEYEHDYNNRNIPAQSAVLLDEVEILADNRRAMSNRNLKLSQTWARLRNRNVLNIVTLPSVYMLDKRLEVLADYWILVERRGVAKPHYINLNDFKPNRIQKEPFDGQERIFWSKIPKSDEQYEFIENKKTDMKDGNIETMTLEEYEKKKEQAMKQARREYRDEIIRELYNNTDLSQNDLASFEFTGVDQSVISRILNA